MSHVARHRASSQTVLRLALYAVVFTLLLRLNRMTDYTSDDFSYHFFYASRVPTQETRLLSGPLDIIGSIASHYQVQNGRSLSHALLQFFALFDKPVFDVVNTLVFLLVGQLVLWHIFGGRRYRVVHEAAVYLAMWLFIPYFGQSVLWMSGSVNYLWMTAVTLGTLLPYRLRRTDARSPQWLTPAMLVVGFIGGSTNENSAGAWILMAVLFIALWARDGRRIPTWSWVGVLGAVAGLVVQLISPGNRLRAERLGGTDLASIRANTPYILKVAVETSAVLALVFAVVLALHLAREGRLTRTAAVATGYVIAGMASGFVMVVTPTMPHRSWIWTTLFLVIAIGIVGRADHSPRNSARLALVAATTAMAVWGGIVYVQAYRSIRQTHAEVAEQLRVVEEHKAAGVSDVVLTKFRQPSNTYNALAYTPNLRAEPDGVVNQWFARFYGLTSVAVDNPEEVYR